MVQNRIVAAKQPQNIQTQPTQAQEPTRSNGPEKKFAAGGVSAAIWTNLTKDSKEYTTISFQRTYLDAKGEWQHTDSMRVQDIPKLMLVAQKAYEYIVLKSDTDPAEE